MKNARVFEPSRSLVHLIEREKGTPKYETASSASANALGFRTLSTDSGDSVEAKLEKRCLNELTHKSAMLCVPAFTSK